MAQSIRSNQPMPRFVIDPCPSEETEESVKPSGESNRKSQRSLSLTNCHETYKDLHGAIHSSLPSHVIHLHTRSRSYPNNYLSMYSKTNEKYFLLQSPISSIHLNMNCLDPTGGTQTPGGSSSRYSLYGSFFDLSESGYYPASEQHFQRQDNRMLTASGHPLLILDHRSRSSTNTFQDKCNDWLRQLNANST